VVRETGLPRRKTAMMDRYGSAVVEERTQPQNLAELRSYLRMEYGLGIAPGFLLREVADGARRPRNRIHRAFGQVVRVLGRRLLPRLLGDIPKGLQFEEKLAEGRASAMLLLDLREGNLANLPAP
jgi:hypothetical protein